MDSVDPAQLDPVIACANDIRVHLEDLARSKAGQVHFRPAASGVTMVGLLPDRPQRGKGGLSAARLQESFDEKLRGYCVNISQGRPTPEKLLQSFLIADAYRNHRHMAAFASSTGGHDSFKDVRFITDELCITSGSLKMVCDLLAVRPLENGHCPMLIELKSARHMKRLVEQIDGFTQILNQCRDKFEALYTAVLGEDITFVCEPERWLVWPGKCEGADRREAELLEQRIGVIQYQQDDTASFTFHVGRSPNQLSKTSGPSDQRHSPSQSKAAGSGRGDMPFGPQSSGDPPYTARMRFHQSWYRHTVLGVQPGTGPGSKSKRVYGNMLTREAGQSGLNFLDEGIHQQARQRLRDESGAVEEYRLLHNMLSSQPMCFNLFGLMIDDLDFATRVFRQVMPHAVDEVTGIRIEHAPEPRNEYLCDRSAFDAYVEFEHLDRTRAFVGIETKLTEPFSQKAYDIPSYRYWTELPDSPWPEESWPSLSAVQYNQLWRNHLLAIAMRDHKQSSFRHGYHMLIAPSEDEQCWCAVRQYQKLLKKGDGTFLAVPLDRFISMIDHVVSSKKERAWYSSFRKRYLDLDASGADWQALEEQQISQ
ncbi:MAG: hypothetical protein HND57_02470 [Planctomycetes bacterium]|nr:hypothetical protein [Planctomycetota bacterium]